MRRQIRQIGRLPEAARSRWRPAVLGGLLALLGGARTLAAQDAPIVQAIWKSQEISFYYQSFTVFYSCSGLEDKVERILRALGADATVRVRDTGCPSAIARMPRVVVRVSAAVEATPQALAEREQGRSTRELAARVRGESAQQAAAMEPFPAQWKAVSLSRGRRGQLDLEPGDCELIDELRRKVLPKLAIRILQDEVQCASHQLNIGQPRLIVEALVALPKPDDTQAGPQ